MDLSQYRLPGGIVLDARRAVWLETEQVLAVSDLHLGYVWAQRHRGALLPVSSPDDTIERLAELCGQVRPARLVLLGDIVHRALPLRDIEMLLEQLMSAIRPYASEWILGNHDRNLEKLLQKLSLARPLHRELRIGRYRFTHGDLPEQLCPAEGDVLVLGHEHPSITIGDGVASHAKCPCFLSAENALMLPAFSRWASGTNIYSPHWSCPLDFSQAIAICDDKLLPISLRKPERKEAGLRR